MSILIAFLLGAVQGIAEFLPVSSSGHLILMEKLFGVEGDQMMFNIIVHIATLVAVVIVFWPQVVEVIKHPLKPFSLMLAVATIITVAIVLIFETLLEQTFGGSFLGFAFLATAIILTITTIIQKRREKQNIEGKKINYKSAMVMGFAQGIAVIPGLSRSGTTICSGVIAGADKDQAASFSFLLSIPIIIASLFYELIKSGGEVPMLGFWQIAAGFISAFAFGLLSIKVMLKIIKKANYYWFAIYLVVISIVAFIVF